MGRKIIMTGNDALYLNVRKKDTPNDDRAILMTGKNARYMEFTPNTEEEIRTAVYNQLIQRRCKHDMPYGWLTISQHIPKHGRELSTSGN